MSEFIIIDSLKNQRIDRCPQCGHNFYIRIQFLETKKKGWRCTNCGNIISQFSIKNNQEEKA